MATLRENKKYHLLLFLISPILGLIYGIKTKKWSYIRWSIFIFVVIYGSVLHPSHMGDGAVHLENVHTHYTNLNFSQFLEELTRILSFNPTSNTNDDPYIHILSYIVGTIFNSPNLFFTGVAIVFGYFYSGAIVKLLSYVNWNAKYNKFYFLFFLMLFLFFQTPGDMQSVRTGTAVWVVIYALISYHQTKKNKYIFLLLTTPIIHIAYIVLIIPFLVVLLSGFRNPKFYFIVFMVSVLSSNLINPESANDIVSQTEIGASKAKSYTVDEERAEQRESDIDEGGATFYKKYQRYLIHYNVLTGLIIFMFLFLRNRGFGEIENTLFSYGLAGASFANFLSFNFAIYNRVWVMASILILALLLIFLSKENLRNIPYSFLKIKLPLFIFSAALFPYILFLLSANLNFTSIYILIAPIAMWVEFDMGISIRGLIGFFM
jgi:hypothetical protein